MAVNRRVTIAQIAESAGVDRIFVDLEYIGKSARQGGMDTVQSHHTAEDVKKIADAVMKAEVLARVNPIHERQGEQISSEEEIGEVIEHGAEIVMLPYFKTEKEVYRFLKAVNGKAKTMLLIETPEAVENIDKILALDGIDEVFIGLNDLSIGYGRKFMFELLADGTVDRLCRKFKDKNLPFGFGGIASLGKGLLPSENVLIEHYRLGSSCVILSRSFCNLNVIKHMGVISSTFINGIRGIREYEAQVAKYRDFFEENRKKVSKTVDYIVKEEHAE